MKSKIIFIMLLLFSACETEQPILGNVHEHADFKVYLNGVPYDFAQEKYMSTDSNKLSNFTHLHDGDGQVIHKHMTTITLGDFFESLGMQLSEECFMTDQATAYCNDETHTLDFYVNGKKNKAFGEYEINDLDRILITYGDKTDENRQEQIEAELASVTDKACVQSEKCPERGLPSDESTCLSSDGCEAL